MALSHPGCDETKGYKPTQADYKKLALGIGSEFSQYFTVADNELLSNIQCIAQDLNTEECLVRKEYFYNTLATELKTYRQNLALTGLNRAFKSLPRNDYTPFNTQLKSPEIFWFGSLEHEALSLEEAEEINEFFNDKWNVIRGSTLRKMDKDNDSWKKKGLAISLSIFKTQYDVLKNGSFADVYAAVKEGKRKIRYRYLEMAIARVERTILKLNKKRLIAQLSYHPILAHISEREITKEVLLNALYNMEALYVKNQEMVLTKLNKLLAKANISNPNRRNKLNTSSFFSFLDYFSIMNSVVSKDQSLCGVVNKILTTNRNLKYIKTAVTFGVGIGLFFFASPVIATAGFVTMHGFALKESSDRIDFVTENAFMHPQSELNFYRSQHVYMAESRHGTNIIIAPVILAGAPFMRMKNILKFIKR